MDVDTKQKYICCIQHTFVRERDRFRVEACYSEGGLYDLYLSSTKQPYKAPKLRDWLFHIERRVQDKWIGFDHLESAIILQSNPSYNPWYNQLLRITDHLHCKLIPSEIRSYLEHSAQCNSHRCSALGFQSLFTHFLACNLPLGSCRGQPAWIAIAADDMIDTYSFLGIYLIAVFLYPCFSTNTDVVRLVKGFFALLIIQLFCILNTVQSRGGRIWGVLLYIN